MGCVLEVCDGGVCWGVCWRCVMGGCAGGV